MESLQGRDTFAVCQWQQHHQSALADQTCKITWHTAGTTWPSEWLPPAPPDHLAWNRAPCNLDLTKGSPVLDFSMTPKKQGTHTEQWAPHRSSTLGALHCKLSGKVQKTPSNVLVEIYRLQSTDFVRTFLLGSKHWKADLHKTLSYSYPLVEFSLTAYGTMINPLLKPPLTSFSQQICP